MIMESFQQIFIDALKGYREDLIVWTPKLAVALLAGTFFVLLAIGIRRGFRKVLERRMEDPLLGNFLSRVFYYFVLLIGIVVCMKIMGLGGVAGGMLAGAGVGAFIIGFAFKDIGENFLAGIMMAFSRPFRVGDTVEVNGVVGSVVKLDLRNTQLKTPDGKDVYIPNASVVKSQLFNYTIDGFQRFQTTFGIDVNDDFNEAMRILLATVSEIDGVLSGAKRPLVMLSGSDVNSIQVTVFFWVDTFDNTIPTSAIRSAVLGRCTKALMAANFYMPNNVVELKNYLDVPVTLNQTS